jgi:hypothetical protein
MITVMCVWATAIYSADAYSRSREERSKMCGFQYNEPAQERPRVDRYETTNSNIAHRAAVKMSALIKSEIGVDIAPVDLRILIKVHFDLLAKYAHLMHEGGI